MATKKTNGKLQMVSPKNELIQQLENSDYIKNPLVYSQIRGDFSLIQTNVLVAIAATMQTRKRTTAQKCGKHAILTISAYKLTRASQARFIP